MADTSPRRHRAVAPLGALLAAMALLPVAACTAGSPASPQAPAQSGAAPTPTSTSTLRSTSTATPTPGATAGRPSALRAVEETWRLPVAVSREVVFADGAHRILVVGGLTAHGTIRRISALDTRTGRAAPGGRLAVAVHDAAGAAVGGRRLVFGGGSTSSLTTVQQVRPGAQGAVVRRLPDRRSDCSAAVVGDTAYLIGGYNGLRYDPWVLAASAGSPLRRVAKLPIPMRYPAVAALGGKIYVFGGERAGRPTAQIQQIDPRRRTATVIGRLPQPLSDAVAVTIRGTVFVLGGAEGAGRSAGILRFRAAHGDVVAAGRLPYPVSDAGIAVAGNAAYLVGGEDPQQIATVVRLTASHSP